MDIPKELYSKIHELMPIICVDIVVGSGDGIILIKRDTEPAKGEWWFCGGRILKGEKLKSAARRIVKREAGLVINHTTYVGHDQTSFDTDPFGHGFGTHTINFVYAAIITEIAMFNIALDDLHVAYQKFTWEEIYEGDFHPYVKKFTGMAENILKK